MKVLPRNTTISIVIITICIAAVAFASSRPAQSIQIKISSDGTTVIMSPSSSRYDEVLSASLDILHSAMADKGLFSGIPSANYENEVRNRYSAVSLVFPTARTFITPDGRMEVQHALIFYSTKNPRLLYVAVGTNRYELQKQYQVPSNVNLFNLIDMVAKGK